MLKKTLTLALAIVIAMAAGSASAQCVIGVYTNADGTGGYIQPTEFQPFNVHVVMFTEDLVNGVAYSLVAPGLNTTLFFQSAAYGPAGTGIGLIAPGTGGAADGDLSVGLGICAVGFSGFPVLVTTYEFVATNLFPGGLMTIQPNADENPAFPVYSDCQGVVKECGGIVGMTVDQVIGTQSTSMGAVKSLFN